METVWQFLKKLRIELPYDLAIPILGIKSRVLKRYLFTAALFHNGQKVDPRVHQWMNG